MSERTIGFIGLGLMGTAMVERLQAQGESLCVLANRSRASVDAAIARGATEASSPKDLAERCDIVMLCMDTSDSVESRVLGDEGVLAGLKPNAVIIDFGTSLPHSTRMLAQKTQEQGGQYLDAPLGRTPQHARQGLLNIMGAGDQATFERVKPVLDLLGENVFYLGASGAGHTIKLLNNFLAMTSANAISELYAVAEQAGVDPAHVNAVIGAGPLGSGMFEFVSNYAINNDPNSLAFAVKNAAKDVGYYGMMVESLGRQSAIAPSIVATMQQAMQNGFSEKLVPELVDYYRG